jgi:hypothetical protein
MGQTMSDAQKETIEVNVTITLGPIAITIKNNDISLLDSTLQKCIEVGKNNESTIKELMGIFGSSGEAASMTSSRLSPTPLAIPKSMGATTYDDIVEIDGSSVKFVSKNAYNLINKEAIALFMYFWDKPLQLKDADEMLSNAWKKIKKIGNYFLDESQLKPYVIKKDDGYVLMGNGRRWVEDEIILKLRSPSSPKS